MNLVFASKGWRVRAIYPLISPLMVAMAAAAPAFAQTTNSFSFSATLAPGSVDGLGLFGPHDGDLSSQTVTVSISYIPADFTSQGDCSFQSLDLNSMVINVTVNGHTVSQGGPNLTNPNNMMSYTCDDSLAQMLLSAGYDQYGNGVSIQVGYTVSKSSPPTNVGTPALGYGVSLRFGNGWFFGDLEDLFTNPLSSNLMVASPYLLGAPSLGDIDLQSLLPNLNFGAVNATGLATDGTSAAIVLFSTTTQGDVTLTANNGTVLLPYESRFMQHPPSRFSNGTLTIPAANLFQIGTLWYAAALLQAPPTGTPVAVAAISHAQDTGNDASFSTPITVTAQQEGGQLQQATIPLVPPPILLVHGIWGKVNSLSFYQKTLGGEAPWSSSPNPIYELFYPGSVSFVEPVSVSDMAKQTNLILTTMQAQGVVGSKIDVVAHSMGGLLLRAYSRGQAPGDCDSILSTENTAPYRSFNNRCLGQFRTIVTLDTPEAGSQMAAFLYRHRNNTLQATFKSDKGAFNFWQVACAHLGATTVGQCLLDHNQPVTTGGVFSLQPNSPALKGTPAPKIPDANWFAISAINTSGIARAAVAQLIRAIYPKPTLAPTIDTILQGPNDDVVALKSQLYGDPDGYDIDHGLAHVGLLGYGLDEGVTNSSEAIAQTACWLLYGAKQVCSNLPDEVLAAGDGDSLQAMPGQLSIAVPPTAVLGKPVKITISAKNVRSYEIEQLVLNGASVTDSVVPENSSQASEITLIPKLLGKVRVGVIATFTDGTFDTAYKNVSIGVDPDSVTSIVADPQYKRIYMAPNSDFSLSSQISVQGLDQPVEIEKLATYKVLSPVDGAPVSVDRFGNIRATHAGSATIEVSFAGHSDQLKVVVK